MNDDADGDMLGSIRRGLQQTPQACPAILVALGDQPGIRRELVKRLLAGRTSTEKGILMPSFRGRRGRRGHPVLIANSFRDEMMDRFDGVGLRGLAAAHPDQVHEIPVDAAAALQDVDTPEEYRRWVAEDSGA